MVGSQQLRAAVRAVRYGRPTAIISQDDYRARGADLWTLGVPAQARSCSPSYLGEHAVDFSSLVCSLPDLGVSMLPNGRACGASGWVFSARGEVIRETTWYGSDLQSSLLPASFPQADRLRGTCLSLISEFAAGNYGHYLLDCLSRLGIARSSGWPLANIDFLYLYQPPSPSARLLLGKLGIPESRCLWADQVPSVIADQMLVTTFPGTKRNYAPVVPQTLSRPFQHITNGERCLYIPRRGTRRISNEDEIERISVRMGLEIYDHRQVANEFEYFRSARLIVGAHGAGLTNIAVCRPGTRILELIPTDHVFPYYYSLSLAAGLDYHCLAGLSSAHRPANSFGPSPYDFTVDPVEYERALATLLP